MRQALALDGSVIVEAVSNEHEPPLPAKVKKSQVMPLLQALREGIPNRKQIALQMVKDMLDESSFDASPGHVIPEVVAKTAGKVADKLNRRGT